MAPAATRRETLARRAATFLSRIVAVACALAMVPLSGGGRALAQIGPRDVDVLPSKAADERVAYGKGALQFGDLRLPKGEGPFPMVVVIHGGCWVSAVATLQNTAAFADALRDAGVATWNVEYRRLGDAGGGWPGTFEDIGAAVDHVRVLASSHPIDARRVAVAGHSAGAHLALWAAARSRLPAASALHRDAPLALRAAVALGGPGDLREFETYSRSICGTAVERLLGGTAEVVGERWAQASPADLLPLGVRQVMIVGSADRVMPPRAGEAYVAKATKAGDDAELVVVPGSHFEIIAPATEAFVVVRDRILALLGVTAAATGGAGSR